MEAVRTPYYDRWTGRPGWPPAVRLRMLVLEQFADLSDREVHAQVGYNLLDRAFVGLGVDEPVPDDTTLVRFRDRVGADGIRAVFELVNQQWAAGGLIGADRRVLDGVHLWAKVARRSCVALLRQGRAVVVEAVAHVDPARAETLRATFVPPASEPEPRGEEAVRAEGERTGRLLAAVADSPDATVQARVTQVWTLRSGASDRVVSFDDPEARWGDQAADKPFCGYKAHEALDPDSRLITAVDVVPGNAHEAVRTDTLLARDTPPRAEGAVVIGDAHYNNATTVAQVEAAQAQPCFSGPRAARVSDRFDYDPTTDHVGCPEGKHSIGKVRVDNGDLDLLLRVRRPHSRRFARSASLGGLPCGATLPGERHSVGSAAGGYAEREDYSEATSRMIPASLEIGERYLENARSFTHEPLAKVVSLAGF